jgi:hypothetical protein
MSNMGGVRANKVETTGINAADSRSQINQRHFLGDFSPCWLASTPVQFKERKPMRNFRVMMAVAILACVGVGCEQEAPKKAPEQKSDLGAPANPNTATSDTSKKP